MARIYQFNHIDGRNQIYVDDLQHISDSATEMIRSLPWTTPIALANVKLSGSGLELTPASFAVVNGVPFGCDTTVTVTPSQYLYAVCEYDTSQNRNKSEGGTYQQAVVRYLKVSDSKLSDTDPNNAPIFPGLGEYLIYHNGDDDTEIPFREDGTTIPFDLSLVVPSGGITSDLIGPQAVGADNIANNAVTSSKIGTGAVSTNKIAGGAVTTQKIAAHAVTRQELDNDLDLQTKFSGGVVRDSMSLTAPMVAMFATLSQSSYELYVADTNLMDDYLLPITLLVWNPQLASKTLVIKRNNSGGSTIMQVILEQSSRYRIDIWAAKNHVATCFSKVGSNSYN